MSDFLELSKIYILWRPNSSNFFQNISRLNLNHYADNDKISLIYAELEHYEALQYK